MEILTITAPDPFDGYFLCKHIETEMGLIMDKKMSYSGTDLIFTVTGMTEEQKIAISNAISSYVHPVDTTKNLGEVAMRYW